MSDIPEEEMEAWSCITINRMNLSRFLRDFQKSVQLFQLLGPPRPATPDSDYIFYQLIAARDGALNIFHFGCSLEAVRRQLPTCPSLARQADSIKLREAQKQFDRDFPHAEMVRHAVAHAGELQKSPKQMRRNAQKAERTSGSVTTPAGGLLNAALSGETYSVGIEGDIFSLTLDAEAIRKLARIIELGSGPIKPFERAAVL